jgi:superfamily II DNA or RNA helicase
MQMSSNLPQQKTNILLKITKKDNIVEIYSKNEHILRTICNSILVFFKKKFTIDKEGKSNFHLEKQPLFYMTDSCTAFTYAGKLGRILEFLNNNNIGYEYAVEDTKNLMSFNVNTSVLDEGSLRYGQKECVEKILAHERGIIEAPTGWGKSHLFGVLCKIFYDSKIDIVLPRIDSLLMVYKRIKVLFPEDTGIVYGEKAELGKRISVISIGSLDKTNFQEKDVVLADEIQNYGTDRRLTLFSKYTKARIYGFSANAKTRLDNTFPALESIFGPIIFHLGYSEVMSKQIIVPIIIKWIPIYSGPTSFSSEQFVKKKRLGLWNNLERNKKISETVSSLPPDEQVLVIVETVEHLAKLIELIPDAVGCYASMDYKKLRRRVSKSVLSSMEETIKSLGGRKQIEEKFRNGEIKRAIATKIWSESVDFPNLSVLIRADGSASPNLDIQIPGRVSRISQGKQYGIIYDFIDLFDKSLFRRSWSRYLNYKKMGWRQENTEFFKEKAL